MITDIFIKTYHKDFVWLEYALLSIKKFASGFRDVVIVTDNDGKLIPENILNIIPVKVFYVNLPSNRPSFVEHGIGYLWQQYIKLTWYDYSDADSVYIFDSDEMFTRETTPDSFKQHGKFYWIYRDWEKAGTGVCWKYSTSIMLQKEPEYDAMCITGFILQKETSIALKNHLCSIHNVTDIWDIFLKYNMRTCSEFNVFGSFIQLYDRKEYINLINIDTSKTHNSTIHKDWSWGGLTSDKIKQKQDIIGKNMSVDSYPNINNIK
jgi:hypothetical protein